MRFVATSLLLLVVALIAADTRRTASEPSEAWLAQAQRHIAAREYRISKNQLGLQAPNREHNLRTYFEDDGIRVVDRSADTTLFDLSLADVSRGNDRIPLKVSRWEFERDRASRVRGSGIVEWYVNGPTGLEQGFDLAARPQGDGELRITLAVKSATVTAGRSDQIQLVTNSGRKLNYEKLIVRDARGAVVPAQMLAQADNRIGIQVDDGAAVYPLVVDPIITAVSDAQLESDQVSANFGFSVAGAGDVNGDGYADVIVGAEGYDAGQTNEGAVFVFYGSASGIADGNPVNAAAQLESDQAFAQFGFSVAGAGDVNGDSYADVIVGAVNYDAGQADEGAAFVFLGSASGIADGNPASAAAQLESDQGSADLGASVAGAGDVNGDGYADVIVGAYSYDAGQDREGAAFVYHGSASGIADGSPATAAAQLESDQANAQLGWNVASAGDVNGDGYADVIVGAITYDAGEADEGAAFVFLGSASGIADGSPANAAAQLESDQASAHLGASLAGAGDVNGDGYADVIVGVADYDAGLSNEGAAFVFLGSTNGITDGAPSTAAAQIEGDQASAYMGYSVAGAGDVNGDGYADVIVGAHHYDAGQTDEGAAFVFLGSANGIANGNPASAAAQLESDQASGHLGISVTGAGDVNDDVYADVIVGADDYDAGQVDEGAAFVFLGSATGMDSTPDPFTFTDVTGVAQPSLQTSNTITVSGIDMPAPIGVSGSSTSEYSIGCTGAFTKNSGFIKNGQRVCVRHVAPGGLSKSVSTTLSIGGVSDTFTSTTFPSGSNSDSTPDSFTFTDYTGVVAGSNQTSNIVTITGINKRVLIWATGGRYSIGCTGTFRTVPSFIRNNQSVCVRHTAATSPNTTVNTTLRVGKVSDTFSSTTAP